ncbi:MAG: hypothetical protein J6X06_05630 [Elusimicrobiaceae bacterium]|nr:hypothetical protein [Elusimicrobiaceae bacterium]
MKKYLFKLIVVLIVIVGAYVAFRMVNRSLIQMALVADIKSSDMVSHSLMDKQAKTEILLLYKEGNEKISELARNSKTYLAYQRDKQVLIKEQEDQMNKILNAYRKRKENARRRSQWDD